jgi:phage tail-like protein
MSGETENTTWPVPKFYFSVDFGSGMNASFQEVAGLDQQTQVIEYRHSTSPAFAPIKMPGLAKVGNVTLRRGIMASSAETWDRFNAIKMNTIQRQSIVIRLLDETGIPQMVWTLNNAWPTKVTGTDLKSEGNEIAVESVEIAFETMVTSAIK